MLAFVSLIDGFLYLYKVSPIVKNDRTTAWYAPDGGSFTRFKFSEYICNLHTKCKLPASLVQRELKCGENFEYYNVRKERDEYASI